MSSYMRHHEPIKRISFLFPEDKIIYRMHLTMGDTEAVKILNKTCSTSTIVVHDAASINVNTVHYHARP